MQIIKSISGTFLCCLFMINLCQPLFSQQEKILKETIAEASFAQKIGTTGEIRNAIPRPSTSAMKKQLAKDERYIPRNFENRFPNRVINPILEHQGNDPIRQSVIPKSDNSPVVPKVNIDGLFAGGSPHDPSGDAGLNYYLQAVNATDIAVYEKDGTLVSQFTGNTLWGQLGYNSGGDPIIMYDQEHNRWIITEFPFGFGGSANQLLFAISTTGDPLGQYDVYAFGTPRFPDYPKYSIWTNAYAVTTNEESAGILHAYVINREQMINGEDVVDIQRVELPGNSNTEARFLVASPVDWSGKIAPPQDRDPMVMALNDATWNTGQTDDLLEIYSISIDWANESNTVFTLQSLPVTPYDSYPCAAPGVGFSCVPQMDGNGLDALPELIMNQIHYRNFGTHESMVLCFITDVTDGFNLSGIRWMELRRSATETWSVYQEGTFAPDDGLHRFMGGIAMDGQGNIGLAYNVSSDTTFAGIRFTGRRVNDPLGMMTIPEYNVVEGMNTINSQGRFADYIHMTIDAEDDRTFWYTAEYANAGTSYTRILSFELKKDTIDMGPVALRAPQTGGIVTDDEFVRFTVQNFGIDPIDSFTIGYILEGMPAVTEDVQVRLEEGDTYEHTFSETISLDELGKYNFRLFTVLEGDEAPFNDTIDVQVTRLAERNLGVSVDASIFDNNCGSEVEAQIRLHNFGIDTIVFADLDFLINGIEAGRDSVILEVAPGDNILVVQNLDQLVDGTNILQVVVSNPNGQEDQIMSNDTTEVTFEVYLDEETVELQLLTDEFPDETSWELLSQDSTVLFSGGPYAETDNQVLFIETLCLHPDSCYIFAIYDDFGDGFSAYGIDGDYQIVDHAGNVLVANNNPSFGDEEFNAFCVNIECLLEADIAISPVNHTGAGMIVITASNGQAPFMYSIDGGQTFQADPGFANLVAGTYEIVVTDQNDCEFRTEVEVSQCVSDFVIAATSASGEDVPDGQIAITLADSDSTTLYSIDGGISYQQDSVFIQLLPGEYNVVVVQQSLGCRYESTITVDFSVSILETLYGTQINIYPNPTDAMLTIEIKGTEMEDVFLPVTVYNLSGQIVQRKHLTRYSDSYKGMISLYNQPDGIYYLGFDHGQINKLVSVIKN